MTGLPVFCEGGKILPPGLQKYLSLYDRESYNSKKSFSQIILLFLLKNGVRLLNISRKDIRQCIFVLLNDMK